MKTYKYSAHKIMLIVTIMLYSAALCSAVPYINEHIFSALTSGQNCTPWLMELFVALMASSLAKFLRGHEEFIILRKNTNTLQQRMLKNYLRYSHIHSTDRDELSGIINKITEDKEACRLRIWTNILTIIFITLFAAAYIITASPVIMLTVTTAAVSIMCVILKKRKSIKLLAEDIAHKESGIITYQWEYINNREIAPHLDYNKMFAHYMLLNEDKMRSTVALAKTTFTVQFARMFGVILLTFLTAIVGGTLCCIHAMSLDKLFGMLTAIPVLGASLFTLPTVMNDIYSMNGKAKAIPEYLKTIRPQRDSTEGCTLKLDIISLESIHSGNVLKGVTFHAHRGRLCVIAGPSGCGKTTLIKILLCLKQPDSGSITYGDTVVNTQDLSSIIKNVFYISSTPYIRSNTTLRDFISKGRDIDDTYYRQVLSILKIDYLDTDIPLSAEKLSAGEKQKLMILRMIFDTKSIWVCDEPTNKLDRDAEAQILKLLKQIIAERQILAVFVSHREETISAADDLWTMDGGTILERSKQEA